MSVNQAAAAESFIWQTIQYLQQHHHRNQLEDQLPQLCYEAAEGSGGIDLTPLKTCIHHLRDAISLLDDIIDAEIDCAKWAQQDSRLSTLHLAQGATVNIATALLGMMGKTLAHLPAITLCSYETAAALQGAFYDTLWQTAVGQQASLWLTQPSLPQVWEVAEAKSAPYYAFCCWSGARLATDDPALLDKVHQFGRTLGLLIQINDDMYDLWSEPGQKNDLSTVNWSLPTAYALTVCSPEEARHLQTLLNAVNSAPEVEEEIRHIIVKSGALVYLKVEAQRQHGVAAALLDEIAPSSPVKEELQAWLNRIVTLEPA